MRYYLRDRNPQIVQAWKKHFNGVGDVDISCGDIFDLGDRIDAVVSPANSFGFMDGGIDYVYSLRFGWQLQERLQAHLQKYHDGELLVGEGVVIPTYDPPRSPNWPSGSGFRTSSRPRPCGFRGTCGGRRTPTWPSGR
jgi:hypothetical protein